MTALESDECRRLVEAIRHAHASGQRLAISGSGSKSFLMPTQQDASVSMLSVAEHSGVLDYQPDELVLTARAGTPLRELRAIVGREQQMLPFDPPMFAGGGTLGGAIASGLSGPGRPWWGSVRDCVLGIELVNGLGEQLTFGGQVLKNVAGYDLSRLQVGAFGTLGVIMSASIRLLPQPPAERTCILKLSAVESLARVRDFARRPLPLSGTCFDAGLLRVRLSGADAAVLSACAEIGGEIVERDQHWQRLRDHELPTFSAGAQVWRWSLPPGAAAPTSNALIEWAGALRWVTGADADDGALAERLGGTAAPFSAGFAQLTARNMPAAMSRYHQRLKTAFDPKNILNPGLVSAHAG
ncbi:MAG: glycolate oxidase subunit GlcE [Gammaproteobacteria bacterium]|nr:glycolate oxidase subunit GlcE [Gammaproteobacteria bacterium]